MFDVATVLSSVGISATAATWLTRKLISHRLDKNLERYKGELTKELENHKNALTIALEIHKGKLVLERDAFQSELRHGVERELGDEAAEREYRSSARKRLYEAIGPLRFQILLSCRDLSGRVVQHTIHPFQIKEVHEHYGRSFLYRMLRPIAVLELIERQLAYADFSVDPGAIEILRLQRCLFDAWTGPDPVLKHPEINWQKQTQHVFSDSLRRASCTLIMRNGSERVATPSEFQDFLTNPENLERLNPFPQLLEGFSVDSKPILWMRLVSAGLLCNRYVESQGKVIGFNQPAFPLRKLLQACHDPYVRANLEAFEQSILELANKPL